MKGLPSILPPRKGNNVRAFLAAICFSTSFQSVSPWKNWGRNQDYEASAWARWEGEPKFADGSGRLATTIVGAAIAYANLHVVTTEDPEFVVKLLRGKKTRMTAAYGVSICARNRRSRYSLTHLYILCMLVVKILDEPMV